MVEDKKRICALKGCSNMGQYHDKYTRVSDGVCVITRRPLCVKHRCEHRGVEHRNISWSQKKFSRDHCHKCDYCGWVGPCDTHRLIPAAAGGAYVEGNMKSACPNCHRLISMKLIVDKFLNLSLDL